MLLLGATFTSEYAIEAAALCNPSIVAHPDQAGVAAGSLRFVMSVRGIGEGHRSSIGFRTGVVDAEGGVTVDDPARFATVGSVGTTLLDAAVFRNELARLRDGGEAADYVLDALGDRFTRADLDEQLDTLRTHMSTRGRAQQTISLIRAIAERFYAVEFADDIPLSERVLFPAMGAEVGRHGGRALRPLRRGRRVGQVLRHVYGVQRKPDQPAAAGDDGLPVVHVEADGGEGRRRIRGWRCFRVASVGGSPRCRGRTASRIRLPIADDPFIWPDSAPCQQPTQAWEALQLGNCGPPIETEAGWLVLTHGVGPMRTYRSGRYCWIWRSRPASSVNCGEPLLSPAADEQDGYVPNVVYSCGALVHGETLVIPYGIGDAAIGIATVPLRELLAELGD